MEENTLFFFWVIHCCSVLWPLGGCLIPWDMCSVGVLAKERVPVNVQMDFG